MSATVSSEVQKGFRKIVYLTFPPGISSRPVVCNLARLFDLSFNILKAEISPRQEGTMTLEISGLETDFHKGVNYLKENSVRITPVAQKIFRDEDSCIHCGVCTAMCPTGALAVDKATRKVIFEVDKCSACGLCTRVCPVRAMAVDLDENGRQ
ncbi:MULTISPECIES: NIL domain-containing protein [Desulfovibrio]|jgi:ferredoxin|uniref:NIL domain-containing protein n=1 Tax=Desulfovibrio TaxID=872 RepID=UPI0004142980|nr:MULTISPECIES: NIL domain-containing protein [Desulfovibrio]MDY0306780.1 4Fe-4S binding protein [Desulfovibrionaceae bacterium]HMM37725.1 4Fe-4S binding protein [Desulfovibrio sp.]